MSERKLRLEILTPEKLVYRGDVDMVVAVTAAGEVGILPLHIPLVAPLEIGEVRVKIEDKDQEYVAVQGGYIEVREDKVTLLADDAVLAGQVDLESARELKEAAEQELGGTAEGEPDFFEAQRKLDWALSQLRVAERLKK